MRLTRAAALGLLSLLVSAGLPAADSIAGWKLIDLHGQVRQLGGRSGSDLFAVVFLGLDCPISRKSIPKLNALARDAGKAGIGLYGVISDPAVSRKRALEHEREFAVTELPLILDESGELALALKPTHVPEAFVFHEARIVYRGAIDDAFAAVGQERSQVKARYLADALSSVASGKSPPIAKTDPVGCFFETGPRGASATVTYARHIAPILNVHCVTCHREGEVAPFTLTGYADASRHARQIAKVTRERLMPPWMPAEGFASFLDETRLRGSEIALLAAWAEAGAPQGDPADLPELPRFPRTWRLGEPDLVLKMPERFTVPAEGKDTFRCFVLPTGLAEDKVVVGVEYRPGAPKVVHHALFFLDGSGAARRLDERDEGPGYKTFGGVGFFPSGGLGGYAPGAQPRRMPEGTGRMLEKGSDVVLQVHYHSSGKVEEDQGSLALYFAKEPVKSLISGTAVMTRRIDIPPGESHYVREASMLLPCDVTLIGAAPHMHYLGKEMKAQATTPAGETIPLIWMKDWDFRWQGQYLYSKPIRLLKGTRIDLRAVYDNSAQNVRNPNDPPRRVTHGEQTTDEMCICFFQIIADSPEDRQLLRRQALLGLFRGSEPARKE